MPKEMHDESMACLQQQKNNVRKMLQVNIRTTLSSHRIQHRLPSTNTQRFFATFVDVRFEPIMVTFAINHILSIKTFKDIWNHRNKKRLSIWRKNSEALHRCAGVKVGCETSAAFQTERERARARGHETKLGAMHWTHSRIKNLTAAAVPAKTQRRLPNIHQKLLCVLCTH